MKRLIRGIALILIIAIIAPVISNVSVSAASYPLVVVHSSKTTPTIIAGETGQVCLMIFPEYKNEKYHMEIYNSAGKLVGSAENSYYNTYDTARYITITIDTDKLDMGVGTYTVKYWLSFYTMYQWYDAPNQYTYTIKVLKNTCKGNHNFVLDYVVDEGNCQEARITKEHCTKCGHIVYVEKLGEHTYDTWSRLDEAQHQHTCTECGAVEKENHNWNAGVVTKQPTCATTGVMTYTCTDCGGTKTETIAKTTDHTYGKWSKVDNTTHKHTCTVCNKVETTIHYWNQGVVTKQPTCAATGVMTYTCEDCGGTMTEAIAKTNDHTYGKWSKVDDNTHKHTCTVCNNAETANHHWDEGVVTKQPTCAATGVKTYTCTDCGGTKTETIAKTNDHTYGEWTKVEDINHCHKCSLCGKIETTAHKWDSGTITLMPTLDTTGLREHTCVDCGATKTVVVPKRANGDLDGDLEINNKDVEYLLWYTLFPESYPLEILADFDGSGVVDNKDVEYLLWHTLFPESYPL